jgi:hypothetical protein
MTEPMSPWVCRNARPKTARMVSAVVIAGQNNAAGRPVWCGVPPATPRSPRP